MKNIRKLKTMLLVALLGWAGVANAEDWTGTIGNKNYSSGGNVVLKGNVTLSGTVTVSGGTLNITTNGNWMMTRASANANKLFNVTGGSLVIDGESYTITIDGNGVFHTDPLETGQNPVPVIENASGTSVTLNKTTIQNRGFYFDPITGTTGSGYASVILCRGTLTCTNCNFNNNSLDSKEGYTFMPEASNILVYGQASFTNCNFNGNFVENSGGAITAYNATSIQCSNCSFDGNYTISGLGSSGPWGGAICLYEVTTSTFTDCSFTNNYTPGEGGAVYAYKSSSSFYGCVFDGNYCYTGGGAAEFYNCTSVLVESSSTRISSFNDNHAYDCAYGGGAIYNRSSTLTMNDVSITNNSATGVDYTGAPYYMNMRYGGGGGGIYQRAGTVTLNRCTITGNQAETATPLGTQANSYPSGGGGIFNGATMYMEDCVVSGNSAYQGGGIYQNSTLTISGTDLNTIDVHHNTAVDRGGGIYKKGWLKVEGYVQVEDNTSNYGTATARANNVYIPTSATRKYVTINDNGLVCGSNIGITKTSDEHTYEPDDIFGGVRTDIAQGLQANCDFAFHNRFFFDDTDTYHVHNLVQGSTNPYANAMLYFIDTWNTYTPEATVNVDYKADGDGYVTEVMTAKGLAYFAWHVNHAATIGDANSTGNTYSGKLVKQTADIDLAEHYWEPIGIKEYGDCSTAYHPFKGTFDGQGYVIRNVRSILPYDAMGFFGYVDGGTITRTFVESGTMEATGSRAVGIGGLVGRLVNGATVTYSEARVTLKKTATATMGGLVGLTDGTASSIHSSMAMSDMTNNGTTGGLVGQLNAGSSLKNSFSNAKYTVTGSPFAGGIVGINAGTVSNCYANDTRNANSIGSEVRFGWLVGQNRGVVEYCFAPNSTNYINDNTEETTTYTNTEPGYFTASESLNGKYKYNQYDQRATGGDTHKPTSGKVNLLGYLNHWVSGDYAQWTRTLASPINTDYPVLELPTFACAGSTDGLFIWYSPSLDAMTTRYNALDGGGSVYLYTPQENVSVNNDSDVNIYIGEDIGITQTTANTLQSTHVGITLDNDDGSDLGGQLYDWHMFSTPLINASMGLTYSTEYLGIDNSTWGDNGVWPVDPPTGSLTIGANCYFPGDTPYGPPQTEISPTGGCFDFYCFSEPFYHWVNFKRHSTDHWHQNADNTGNHASLPYGDYNAALTWVDGNETVMIPGKGYMMAVDKETTLINSGTLSNGEVQRKVTCSDLESPMSKLKGFNLVGNPFQSYLNFNEFANDNGIDTYYILDANAHGYLAYTTGSTPQPSDWMNGVVDYTASQYIHPHQGFFVHTDEAALTLKFQSDARCASVPTGFTSNYRDEATLYPLINLVCTDAEGMCDYATIELNRPEQGGGRKAKGLHAGDGIIYTRLGSEDYHIAFTECGTQSVNLHFEAFENGIFTLRWNMQNGDFSYLHLIDNLTGSDIDCLVADEYRFEASTHDYTSRFRLVFDFTGVEENDEPAEGSGSFIFQMGDELIVNGEGLLQMFDLNGRCLVSETLHGQQSAVGMPSVSNGVYIMRLTANNQTRTQKMVINK